jgi:glycosyltransferase involved in cell wall biosynthesis
MASGTPVVTTPVGALPEVCGDAVRYATGPRELADVVDAVLEDPSPWRERGVERAARYSWDATARGVDALLHR